MTTTPQHPYCFDTTNCRFLRIIVMGKYKNFDFDTIDAKLIKCRKNYRIVSYRNSGHRLTASKFTSL